MPKKTSVKLSTASTSPRSIQLPVEIWTYVFEHAWDAWLRQPSIDEIDGPCLPREISQEALDAFRSFFRTCRNCKVAAEPFLWRHVFFGKVKDVQDYRKRAVRRHKDPAFAFKWLHALWVTDKMTVEASIQVHKLLDDHHFPGLRDVVVYPSKSQNYASERIQNVLEKSYPNIRTLSATVYGFKDALSLRAFSSLQTLSIRLPRGPNVDSEDEEVTSHFQVPSEGLSLPFLRTFCLGRLPFNQSMDPLLLWGFLAKCHFPALADIRLDITWAAGYVDILDPIDAETEASIQAFFSLHHALSRVEVTILDSWDLRAWASEHIPVTHIRCGLTRVTPYVAERLPKSAQAISFFNVRSSKVFTRHFRDFLARLVTRTDLHISTVQIGTVDAQVFEWDKYDPNTSSKQMFFSALLEMMVFSKLKRPQPIRLVDATGQESRIVRG